MVQVLGLTVLCATVDAQSSEATVSSNRARLVRTATLATSGIRTLELVDPVDVPNSDDAGNS